MHCIRPVTDNLFWVGADDHRLILFENLHPIPDGVSYNSYLLLDEKTVLFDTVDRDACNQFIENVKYALGGRRLDYLVIQHMEPDHAASISEILARYPETIIISNEKAFKLMRQFGIQTGRTMEVKDGDTFSFGSHTVTFIFAPMVHWPEVMVTLDLMNGALFSADAFGTFGALNDKLFADETDFDKYRIDDARRYYSNIVGKYGPNVQKLLGKANSILDKIKFVCPLHGPVWRKDLPYFIGKYDKWSRYEPEEKGIVIIYASMYGNTESAAMNLGLKLSQKGYTNFVTYDVSKTHVSYLVSETFKSSHIVLASVTYSNGVFPPMLDYLEHLKALNVQKRTFAIIENGSWVPKAGDYIEEFIQNDLKEMTLLPGRVTIHSAPDENTDRELDELAGTVIESINANSPDTEPDTLEHIFKDYSGESFKTELVDLGDPVGYEKL